MWRDAVIQAQGEIQMTNPGLGKIVIAVIIIMALWGQKTDRGGKGK
jgi:hypothetical protein